MKRKRFDVATDDCTNLGNAERKIWVKERQKVWWQFMDSSSCTEFEFKNAFRMSKGTFEILCNELKPIVTKQNTNLREAIPVRERVAVCIWRLATGESLRQISKRFGLGVSTCHKIVLEVCSAIKDGLMQKFISWPESSRMCEIVHEFENSYKIPNIVGCIYTTEFEILNPKENLDVYLNETRSQITKKPYYSVKVQGVVDHQGVFTDTCIGYPGSMSDEEVLYKSSLFLMADNGQMKGVSIVGNVNHPLMSWVLVPYSACETSAELLYNERVGEVNLLGRGAFKKLRARWRCLMERTDINVQDLSLVIGVCCVLHNFCERMGEEIGSDLMNFEM